jgi:glycine hydroxymethyltransferase
VADRLDSILADHREFRRLIVPLCAAETPISDYVRSFLTDSIHEAYAMGGPLQPPRENFASAEYVHALHTLTIELCNATFGSTYADPRPLSGTSAVIGVLMTLSQPGHRIALQTVASGGHASMLPICRRLGLEVVDLPYDFDRLQFDIDAIAGLDLESLDFVLLAPSDLLYAPVLDAVEFSASTIVIYDATQSLGLIASGNAASPFGWRGRILVSAGTHKTLPGPSSGLLLTRDEDLGRQLDAELSPKFVRHSHPHHIASLCAALIEQRTAGSRYSAKILQFSRDLSRYLENEGLDVIQDANRHTETHQVFLYVSDTELDGAYQRATAAGITLNVKRKPLFRDSGLRLGVQEIARYRWSNSDLKHLAVVLAHVVRGTAPAEWTRAQVRALAANNEFAEDLLVPFPTNRKRILSNAQRTQSPSAGSSG